MEKINHLKSTIEHHDLVRIGVMGSASLAYDEAVAQKCRRLGRAIAQEAYCLLTGACPGLPHETVLGAKEVDGHTIGISPAASLREHVEVFDSPHLEYDVMIYTGLGLMGRELINIRSSDIIIVVGGRTGTLGEFAIAHEEGKLIGVLQGSGGIADRLDELEPFLGKATGSVILYDADPERLVASLVAKYKQLRDNPAPSSTLLGTSRSGLLPQS
ncbi:MAG: hypothetical protein WAO58_11160 [Fimbriimonadaceae bacterium]